MNKKMIEELISNCEDKYKVYDMASIGGNDDVVDAYIYGWQDAVEYILRTLSKNKII